MTSGKIAPFVPMEVPMTTRVSGSSSAIRMTNGIERKTLMTLSSTA